MTHDERLKAFVSPDGQTLYPAGENQYSYDPRHMLCRICTIEVLGQRFYDWWLAERKSAHVISESVLLRNMTYLIHTIFSSRSGRLLVGLGMSNSAKLDPFSEIERE